MKLATVWTTCPEGRPAAINAYHELVRKLGAAPHLLILHSTVDYEGAEIVGCLRELAPNIPLIGGTSFRGVMTEAGFHGHEGPGLALLGIHDPAGSYGVGTEPLGKDPLAAAQAALDEALAQASRPGEVPAIIWMAAAPGQEERLIRGIEELVGPNVPIAGGSTADNDVSGKWRQFANGTVHEDAVVLSAMFPSEEVIFAFHSGYEPTEHQGTVTRAEGRILREIEGRPAIDVYDEWTHGGFSRTEGDVLTKTNMHPLGTPVGTIGSIPYFRLSHPARLEEDGALALFSDIEEGDEVTLMEGTLDNLVSRPGYVAQTALALHSATPDDVHGALVICCAGCLLGMQERMPEVSAHLQAALGGKPFLGAFTFGEQGCFLGGENCHGNLMISVLMFRKKRA